MKTTPDRIELMQTFVRIVEAGSLSAAAAQMGATQPTVSRRLQTLERSLGIKLLQRSTHAMQLTEDGARCFARAKELLDRAYRRMERFGENLERMIGPDGSYPAIGRSLETQPALAVDRERTRYTTDP